MRSLITLCICLLLQGNILAQYGYLDSSYAINGKQNYPDFIPYLYYDRGLTLIDRSDNTFMLIGDILEKNDSGTWLPVLKFKNDIADGQTLCNLSPESTNFNLKCAVGFGGPVTDKFLIAGSKSDDVFIKKFDADGNPDITFGQGGEIIMDLGGKDIVRSMQRLSNGHYFVIIRSGDQLIIRKLKSDGSWDLLFANSGSYTIPVVGTFKVVSAIDDEDNLYLTTSASQIVKISRNGEYQDQYTTLANLYLSQIINHILPLADGSVLVSGNELTEQRSLIIQKLMPNGEQDTSFGTNGKTVVHYNGKFNAINDVQVYGSRIYVFGDINQAFFLAQLDKDGFLVPEFGTDGKLIIQYGASLAYGLKMKIYPYGKALLLGSRQDWLGVARAIISETPVITASSSDTAVCRNTDFTLLGQGGITYHWEGSNGFTSDEANPTVNIPESYAGSQVIFTLTGYNADGFSAQDVVTIDLKPKIEVDSKETLPCFGETHNQLVTITKNFYFDDKTIAIFDTAKAKIVEENNISVTFSFDKANSPLTVTLHDTADRYCDVNLSFDFHTEPEIKATLETTTTDSTCVSVITPEDESQPLAFLWSNGATTKISSQLPAGAFSVTVTNTKTGCSAVFEDECIPETNATNQTLTPNKIYPNPVLDIFHIDIPFNDLLAIYAYDAAGREARLSFSAGENRVECKVANLQPGIYILKIINRNGSSYISKIIKQ